MIFGFLFINIYWVAVKKFKTLQKQINMEFGFGGLQSGCWKG